MLLAVEGGGFFSSSASGYSKGFAHLLLGQRKQQKPMRVTPWNQYQLVDQVTDPNLQLASAKNWLVRGCASFVCLGRTTAGSESPSALKVGPTQKNQEVLPEPVGFDDSKDQGHLINPIVEDGSKSKIISLRSSLKKTEEHNPGVTVIDGEKARGVDCQIDRRKVQWTDNTGGELFEIREFEMSEEGSDYEFNQEGGKVCSCKIM